MPDDYERRILRPFAAKVDLGSIERNIGYLKGILEPGCRFMAVVKANGYGHGDVEVSKAALRAGAHCLGVAILEEAVRLRAAGIDCPVHLLFEPPPEAAGVVVEHRVVCSVYTVDFARALAERAQREGVLLPVHVKVDTGMRRVGIIPEQVGDFVSILRGLDGIKVEGIYTHFATADDPDSGFTKDQIDRFLEAVDEAESVLARRLVRHAANSAGVLMFKRSHLDMARVGIAMYGLHPSVSSPRFPKLEPALSLEGEVALVKKVGSGEGISYGLTYSPESDVHIGTLPVGYADGFSRILSNRAEVLIGGERKRIVGNICMDLCMVELGREPVEEGTPFVLIGRQGKGEITADEVAARLGTINYEVLCMISSRVPRVYIYGDEGRSVR